MNQNQNYDDVDLSGMLKISRRIVDSDEYGNTRPRYGEDTSDSKMVKLAIKHSGGLIKDKKQANFVLLGIALVAVIISLFVSFSGGKAKPVYNKNVIPGAMHGMPIKNM